jgi:hypothetical protein
MPARHVRDVEFAVEHASPHPPQWLALTRRSSSQPVSAIPSQFANVPEQAATAHVPPTHTAVAFASRQGSLHAPQWATVVDRSVSQPLPGSSSQSPKPSGHGVLTQSPLSQATPATCSHDLVHEPQRNESVMRLVSQPLSSRESQSPKPLAQPVTTH